MTLVCVNAKAGKAVAAEIGSSQRERHFFDSCLFEARWELCPRNFYAQPTTFNEHGRRRTYQNLDQRPASFLSPCKYNSEVESDVV